MKNSTLDALAHFSRNEKELSEGLFGRSDEGSNELAPKDQTIQNILNYSKALSVRRSETIDHIFVVLN